MAAAYSQCTLSPATWCFSSSTLKHSRRINSPDFFKPIPSFCGYPLSLFSRVVISPIKLAPSRCRYRLLAVAELADSNSESNTEANAGASDSTEVASIDTKLPRRSLLVQFTCDECGVRTDRLINRVAYERGTVYVQCAGCEKYHKLVDNLGLVVEYDLREEMAAETNTDQAL